MGKLTKAFADSLNNELRRVGHPWAELAVNSTQTVGERISEGHLGLRSRAGTPLNGGEALNAGLGHDRNPYTWGYGPVPYWDLWSIEWHVAEQLGRAALHKGGKDERPAHQKDQQP